MTDPAELAKRLRRHAIGEANEMEDDLLEAAAMIDQLASTMSAEEVKPQITSWRSSLPMDENASSYRKHSKVQELTRRVAELERERNELRARRSEEHKSELQSLMR